MVVILGVVSSVVVMVGDCVGSCVSMDYTTISLDFFNTGGWYGRPMVECMEIMVCVRARWSVSTSVSMRTC